MTRIDNGRRTQPGSRGRFRLSGTIVTNVFLLLILVTQTLYSMHYGPSEDSFLYFGSNERFLKEEPNAMRNAPSLNASSKIGLTEVDKIGTVTRTAVRLNKDILEARKRAKESSINSRGIGIRIKSKRKKRRPQDQWKNPYNIVHVVHTNFFCSTSPYDWLTSDDQHHKLLHLCKAKLNLFKTFTLSSMQKQQQNHPNDYLWLIQIDPLMDDATEQELVEVLSSVGNHIMQNVVVIRGGRKRRMKTEKAGRNKPSAFLYGTRSLEKGNAVFGNWELLQSYTDAVREARSKDQHNARSNLLVVETMLDAGDALATNFIQVLQRDARGSVGGVDLPTDFRIYCTGSVLEWQQYSPWDDQNIRGAMLHYIPEHCLKAGISVAYNPHGGPNTDLLNLTDSLYSPLSTNINDASGLELNLPEHVSYCDPLSLERQHKCWKRIGRPGVLRVMTTTNAGLARVYHSTIPIRPLRFGFVRKARDLEAESWKLPFEVFGVSESSILETKSALETDQEEILRDAIISQCTATGKGQTCKVSVMRYLEGILKASLTLPWSNKHFSTSATS